MPPPRPSKVLDHAQLLRERRTARVAGRRLVQCHGCFDIVHPGHIRHLRFAKSQGDLLLVTITADARIAKGQGRPLIPQELRAENLAALDFVDLVHIDDRPTAADLLAEVEPDVYVKGKEYESNRDPRFAAERRIVEEAGGRVVFSSGDVVFSSTALIHAMESCVDPFHHRLTELHARPELGADTLLDLIQTIRGRRVVVVGETITDTYVLCDRPDIAGESPVITLRPLERRHYDGGAAILARHAAALGASPVLVTALPDDGAHAEAARLARQRLEAEGVEVHAIVSPAPIPEKQRFLVGAQKVMKVDLVEPATLSAAQRDALVGVALDAAGDHAHAAIVADFGLGLLSPETIGTLCEALRPRVGTLAGDLSGRRAGLRRMKHMDLLAPSEAELRDAYGEYGQTLPAVVWGLLDETESASAIVSMGADGLVAFERTDREPDDAWASRVRGEHIPALTPHAIDALGCGDALLATATLARSAGATPLQTAYLGAVAAAVQAQRIGNHPVGATDLRQAVARLHAAQLTYAAPEVISAAKAGQPAA